jgi:ion channel
MSSSSTIECEVAPDKTMEVTVIAPVTVTGRPDIVRVSSILIEGPARVTFTREQPQELRLTVLMATLYGVFYALERLSISFYVRGALVKRVSRWASAQFMDCYILAWIAIELLLFGFGSGVPLTVVLIIAIYRLIEVTQAYTNIVIFHRLRHNIVELGPYRIVSHWRTFVIGVINLIEGALLYGLLQYVFAKKVGGLTPSIASAWDALYFSIVTITTLGYGDIQPIHLSRPLAALEAVWGLLFGIALLGRFVAALPPDRALDESGT